ncbi:MAG: hypothetical protein ABIM49_03815 [candidate division WOR-3 bacterium]
MKWKVNLEGELLKGKIIRYAYIFENTEINPPSSDWTNIFSNPLLIEAKEGILYIIFYIEVYNQGGNFYHQYAIRINDIIDEESYANLGNTIKSFINATIFSIKNIEDGTYKIEGVGRSINAGNTKITIRKLLVFNLI